MPMLTEESGLKVPTSYRPQQKSLPRSSRFISKHTFRTLLLSIVSVMVLYRTLGLQSWFHELPTNAPKEFQWNQITPSKTLEYTDCFDGFQCARLDIPLDWNNTDGPRASMAIAKLPAKVPVTDPRYGGIIILNPGGPGGSGVGAALQRARGIQVIADSELDPFDDDKSKSSSSAAKYFDIMSFDPRGVNNSSPKIIAFPDAISQYRWQIQAEDDGTLETDFEKVYVRSRTLSASLSRQEKDSETGIGRFTNTSPVVADMVEFIEQHGKWREEEARRWLATPSGRYQVRKNRDLETEVLERTKWHKGEEKLLYWGFSYGTVLGGTFSAMQPHRVARVILDGNVPLADYYRGDWLQNLQDTDLIMDKFVEYCHQSGPVSCSLYETSPSAIMQKIETLLTSLKKSPIGVPAPKDKGPEIITYRDVRYLIREKVYSPLRDSPLVANILQDLISGNGSVFADYKRAEPNSVCSIKEIEEIAASPSILCTDAESQLDMTKDEFKEYLAELRSQSRWMGDLWADIRVSCLNWDIRAKWKFAGSIGGNTAHPLLLLNPTLDPVTPLRNAYVTANLFNGSVVLEQNSEGHCTYAAPSICTAKHIRNYFQTGALPPPNTVCLPERRPFIGSIRSPDEPELSLGDRRLLDALEELTAIGAGD